MVVLGDAVNAAIVAGIALVSLGTMAIAFWRPPRRSAVGWALLTGATIAAYTVVDAKGARAAPSAASYIVWGFLFLGGGIATVFATWRGKAFLVQAKQQWKPGVLAGARLLDRFLRRGPVVLPPWRRPPPCRLARDARSCSGCCLRQWSCTRKSPARAHSSAATIAAGAVILLAAP